MRWLRRNAVQTQARLDATELFDEAFQKKLEYLALVSRRVLPGTQRAERRSRRAGSGIEFADYRSYYAGDDYRQIDWNVYGRIDRLMLRLREQEEDLSVYLLLDGSGSMAFGTPAKLDYAKLLVASLAYVALSHLDRVSITVLRDTTQQRLAPIRGKNHIFTILDFLRPLKPEGRTSLRGALSAFAAQNKRRGVAVLISDLFDPGYEEGLSRLRYAGFEVHVLHLVDQRDASPQLHGELDLIDAESGEERSVAVTPQLLSRYQKAYQAHLKAVAAFCVKQQIGRALLDTQTPVEKAMLEVLRRERLLA